MIRLFAALTALCVAIASFGVVSRAAEAYAPMAAFSALAGKSFRGEWADPDGSRVVDLVKYELILDGRALQSTHKIEGSTYGGRTIIFYDEGAKKYVYHYFTTAGFHTMGEAQMEGGILTASEDVLGHESVVRVTSQATIAAEEMRVEVVYIDKNGGEEKGGVRLYRPVADVGQLFDGSK